MKPEIEDEDISKYLRMKDIIGLEDAKQKIKERLEDYQNNKELYQKYGVSPSHGMLLYGPSGTGKSTLAKAVVRKYRNKFTCIMRRADDFVQSSQRQTISAMKDVFDQIRKSEDDVVFIMDEIDGMFPRRGRTQSPINEQRVSAFLREVGGIYDNGRNNLFIIATSNRPHVIETAVLSGARINSMIYVRMPNEEECKQLIEKYIAQLPIEKNCNLPEILLKYTKGYSGGDYKNLGGDILATYISNKEKGLSCVTIKQVVGLTQSNHKTLEMNIKKIEDFGRRYERTYGVKDLVF